MLHEEYKQKYYGTNSEEKANSVAFTFSMPIRKACRGCLTGNTNHDKCHVMVTIDSHASHQNNVIHINDFRQNIMKSGSSYPNDTKKINVILLPCFIRNRPVVFVLTCAWIRNNNYLLLD